MAAVERITDAIPVIYDCRAAEAQGDLWIPAFDEKDFETVRGCESCGSMGSEPIGKIIIRGVNGPIECLLVMCPQCGLKWLYNRPSATAMQGLYNSPAYYSSLSRLAGIVDTQETTAERERVARLRLNELESYKPTKGRLLEIGFGHNARVLKEASGRGWNAEGIDLSRYAVEIARAQGLNVFCGEFIEFEAGGTYDAIVAYNVIEHQNSPRRMLEKIRGLLREDGIAVIRLPSVEKDETPSFNLLHHYYHFPPDSFERLIKDTGFDVVDKFSSGEHQCIYGISKSTTFIIRKASTNAAQELFDEKVEQVFKIGEQLWPAVHSVVKTPAIKSLIRVFWDEIEEFISSRGFATLDDFEKAILNPRNEVLQSEFFIIAYILMNQYESMFTRYQSQSKVFAELTRRFIQKHGKYPKVLVFGPGAYQEPIELAIIMESIGQEQGLAEPPGRRLQVSAEISSSFSEALLMKLRNDELVYDPSDVNQLAPDLVNKYFKRAEQGFKPIERIRDMISSRALCDLNSYGGHQAAGAGGTVNFIFLNNVISYLKSENLPGVFNFIYDLLAEDGVLFVAESKTDTVVSYINKLFEDLPTEGIRTLIFRHLVGGFVKRKLTAAQPARAEQMPLPDGAALSAV